jgi:hypothetical protein
VLEAFPGAGGSDQVITDHQPERLAASFLRGGDVERLGGRIGVDALREGGRFAQAVAAGALRGARHVAIETGHAAEDDPAAVGPEDDVANSAADRRCERGSPEQGSDERGEVSSGCRQRRHGATMRREPRRSGADGRDADAPRA